jgi:hypothetical protein
MRDYLNGVLSFIGAESLTDEEFESIDLEVFTDLVANYNALLIVLQDREVVSSMTSRLENYFLAKGAAVSTPNNARSNIFVGSELC